MTAAPDNVTPLRQPGVLTLGRFEIKASRWPWQGGGQMAPLNPRAARFGAGWRWALGVRIGSRSVLFDLGWGIVRITRKASR